MPKVGLGERFSSRNKLGKTTEMPCRLPLYQRMGKVTKTGLRRTNAAEETTPQQHARSGAAAPLSEKCTGDACA